MTDASDWRALALAGDGRTLVEASAGTGKTWTIGALYLRLLLEEREGLPPLSPRQIVVATYTNAAADELRRRLRTRLLETLDRAVQGFDVAPDPRRSDLAWLHGRWLVAGQRARDIERLHLALAELDLAPVSTLHRLCARILADHPFAAGATFRTPEMVDSAEIIEALADDLWRVLQSDAADQAAAAAVLTARDQLAALPKRDELHRTLGGLMQPQVVVDVPDDRPTQTHREAAGVLGRVAAQPGIFRRSNSALLSRWKELAAFLAGWVEGRPDWRALPDEDKLRACLDEAADKHIRPEFHHAEDVQAALAQTTSLLEALSGIRSAPRARFFAAIQAWARAELERRLASAGQLGFDDLLTTVHAALQPSAVGTRPLADALFATWPVALIDEFQDTDPVQYGILDAIYRDAEGAARGRLVMIGDPKQAIYRFRGGDIHTYERAKAAVAAADRLTLAVNHRSSDDFVEAVNQFYALVGPPLGAPGSTTPIAFVPVDASGRRNAEPYRGPDEAGRRCLVLHRAAEGEGEALDALRACANRITVLLDPAAGHTLEGNALRPSDVCVLVPDNRQARTMVELLRERGVPCVQRGRQSVFDGNDVASDLLVVLHAVVHCREPALLRAALATRLWGMGYQSLRALRDDTARWQEQTARFHRWQRLWRDRGVLAVVAALIDEIARAQLGTQDGHRVLTDLRHLGELLQAFEEQADGMESVLKWLQQRIEGAKAGGEDEAEAMALRIESDARCVQVMTLHGSKGLEFNLVMLPLMWKHRGGGRTQAGAIRTLSAPDGLRHVVLDEAGRRAVEREEQDERYRVLYVALTRAVHACHVWLDPDATSDFNDALAAPMAVVAPSLTDERLQARGADRIGVVPGWKTPRVAAPVAPAQVRSGDEARPLPAAPDAPLPSRHSFTTLTARRRGFEVDPWAAAGDERDVVTEALAVSGAPAESAVPVVVSGEDLAPGAVDLPARTPHPDLDSLLGVAGADFGNAVHGVLELRTAGQPLGAHRDLVLEQLAKYNVRHRELDSQALADRLIARLQAVLDANLDADGLRLAALPAAALRAELEFNYTLNGASLERLRATCAQHGWPDLVPARAQSLAGLMNGKIDLVFEHGGRFHVLDWKGNDLGDGTTACLEDYAPEALERKMDATRYRFQALLYTVAIERYLRDRLGTRYDRSRHLGECWYLFVRATGLHLPDGTACGVWRHRFDDALLDAVQAELSRTGVATEVAT